MIINHDFLSLNKLKMSRKNFNQGKNNIYFLTMRKILTIFIALFLSINLSQADDALNAGQMKSLIQNTEGLTIEKQLVGIVGAISGTVSTKTRELKPGDKIYLNETIIAGTGGGAQLLLLDQSTFTIGSDSEVIMDTFIYDPETNEGKIVASVKQGSLKVISGLISKKNPDSLTVEVPEGTLGSRGTEFQTIVSKKKTDTLLIGPGKNNTLGLRPGAVLVGNKFGKTMLDNPYSFSTMKKGQAPGKSKQITKQQLKKFKKKMKALKVAKLEGATQEEKKAIRKNIRKELKAQGLEKEEIKKLIKENIKIDKEKRIVLLQERGEDVSELETIETIVEDETVEVEQEASESESSETPDKPKTEPTSDDGPKIINENKKFQDEDNQGGKDKKDKKAIKNKKDKKKKVNKKKKVQKKKVAKKKKKAKKKRKKK